MKPKRTETGYDQIRQQLLEGEDAADRGRTDGVRLIPKPQVTQPSEFEAAVVERARRRAAEAGEGCQAKVAADLEAFRGQGAPDSLGAIEEARQTHELDLDAVDGEYKERLGHLGDAARLARRQTKAVIDATGVQPPSTWSKPIDIVVMLAIAFCGETYFAWLLLEDALGQWQSLIMASVFTAANVMLGAGGGVGALRKRQGVKPNPLEIIRRMLTPTSLIIMGGFHFVLSHWRALGIDGGDIAELPQRILQAPLGPFLHHETWVLAILAATVFGAFAWKAFDFFGGAVDLRKVDKARIKADDAWESEKLEYQDDLADAGERARAKIQASVNDADGWARSATTFSDEILGHVYSTNRLIEVTREAAISISNTYRAANSNCREDGGPASWSSPLHVELRQVSNPEAPRALAERYNTLARQARESALRANDAIRAREKEALDNLDAFFAAAAAPDRGQIKPFDPFEREDA